jgi:hypothetical protein
MAGEQEEIVKLWRAVGQLSNQITKLQIHIAGQDAALLEMKRHKHTIKFETSE